MSFSGAKSQEGRKPIHRLSSACKYTVCLLHNDTWQNRKNTSLLILGKLEKLMSLISLHRHMHDRSSFSLVCLKTWHIMHQAKRAQLQSIRILAGKAGSNSIHFFQIVFFLLKKYLENMPARKQPSYDCQTKS